MRALAERSQSRLGGSARAAEVLRLPQRFAADLRLVRPARSGACGREEPGERLGVANPEREADRRSRRNCSRCRIADRPYLSAVSPEREVRVEFCAPCSRHAKFSDSRMNSSRNVLVNTALAICQVLLLV